MALDAISDVSPRCILQAGRCVVHGVSIDAEQSPSASSASDPGAEIRVLRRRIVELEAALQRAQSDQKPDVAALKSAVEPVTDTDDSDAAADPAEAWVDTTATFEERLAARAFFGQAVGDQPARRWFLDRD